MSVRVVTLWRDCIENNRKRQKIQYIKENQCYGELNNFECQLKTNLSPHISFRIKC